MKPFTIGFLILIAIAQPLRAEQPQDIILSYALQAKQDNAAFLDFDSHRGEQFFKSQHNGGDWSCASCHTDNPAAAGLHTVTKKEIEPMAPSVNPARFTNTSKVEKWFKRNCKDVLNRECTAQEKGDVITYLMSLNR